MKEGLKKIYRILIKALAYFILISVLSVMIFRVFPVPVTPLMIIRCFEQLFNSKPLKLKKDWVSIDEISPHLPVAVMCAEDQNFLNHNGFDYKAIEKAMKHNERSKRKRGASTISQQTAKNLFLWSGRSWIRKGFEVYFTFLIELIWDKERIMEVYLNIIEIGDGIYGAQAASSEFFKKDAVKLTKSQAALIAAVLPNPRRFSVVKPSSYVKKRQQWILKQMGHLGSLKLKS